MYSKNCLDRLIKRSYTFFKPADCLGEKRIVCGIVISGLNLCRWKCKASIR